MTANNSSFGKRMLTRMSAAYKRLEQLDEVVSQAVPVLQQAVSGNKQQLDALQSVLDSLKETQALFDAATGHLSEAETSSLRYEMANVTTFINAMDIYFSTELNTVKSALEKFDIPVLQEAYEKIGDERFIELEQVIQRARESRFKKSKKKELRHDNS